MTPAGALVSQMSDRDDANPRGESCGEEQRHPGGGEQFAVGRALVGGEEHVGVGEVEGRGQQRGIGRREAARYSVHCHAGER